MNKKTISKLKDECIKAVTKDEFSGIFDLLDKYKEIPRPCLLCGDRPSCTPCFFKYSKCFPIRWFAYNNTIYFNDISNRIRKKAIKKLSDLINEFKNI